MHSASLDPKKVGELSRHQLEELLHSLVRNLREDVDEDCLSRLSPLCSTAPKLSGENADESSSPSKSPVSPIDTPIEKDPPTEKSEIGKKKKKKDFNIANYHQRHIALQVYYDGSKYYGFASSTGCETVEDHLFGALLKLRLIESRSSCGYTRCGRTDKGVSALGQVIALRLRSNQPLSKSKDEEGQRQEAKEEMDYCSMLNKSLPEDIRILGWSEVSEGFSARFSAVSRTYRYFFLRKDLDIEAMREAAEYLIGEHDFRNICKMDVANVTNFRREIYRADIACFSRNRGSTEDEVWMLEIEGIAFLWHMVRCIMALLFLVGQRKESPDIIRTLLDIDKVPAKPEYFMAPELPLVLHSSGYEKLIFSFGPRNLFSLMGHFEALFERYFLAAQRISNALSFLNDAPVSKSETAKFLRHLKGDKNSDSGGNDEGNDVIKWREALSTLERAGFVPSRMIRLGKERNNKYQVNHNYVPLLQRSRAETYSSRIQNLKGSKRRRLDNNEEKKQEAREDEEDEDVNHTFEFFKRMRAEGSVQA